MTKKQIITIFSLVLIYLTLRVHSGNLDKSYAMMDDKTSPLVLITKEEAGKPDLPTGHFEAARVFENGPIIEVKTPEDGKTYPKPLSIEIRFFPRENKEVDIKTLKVEYLKLFTIDITERILPYANKNGIKIAQADLPSGKHCIRLTVGDVTGAFSCHQLTVNIK